MKAVANINTISALQPAYMWVLCFKPNDHFTTAYSSWYKTNIPQKEEKYWCTYSKDNFSFYVLNRLLVYFSVLVRSVSIPGKQISFRHDRFFGTNFVIPMGETVTNEWSCDVYDTLDSLVFNFLNFLYFITVNINHPLAYNQRLDAYLYFLGLDAGMNIYDIEKKIDIWKDLRGSAVTETNTIGSTNKKDEKSDEKSDKKSDKNQYLYNLKCIYLEDVCLKSLPQINNLSQDSTSNFLIYNVNMSFNNIEYKVV